MLWTLLQSFSFIALMASEELISLIFFANLAFRLPWKPMKFWGLDKNCMFGTGPLHKHFWTNCNEIAINANFHFSYYKPMKILSCHSKESTHATAIKNIVFIETNVMIISVKFQLHPPYGLWGNDFFIFFFVKFSLSNSTVCTKIISLVEDYSINISEKLLPKYLQWDSNKCQFSFFPLQVNGNFKLP